MRRNGFPNKDSAWYCPLDWAFDHVTRIDDTDMRVACWYIGQHGASNIREEVRTILWNNLWGTSRKIYAKIMVCGSHTCVNPWHCKRGELVRHVPVPPRFYFPEIRNRTALYHWYMEGNRTWRKVYIEDVPELLAAQQPPS